MAELTKEYLDQKLEEQTEALARIVNHAFQQHSDYLDKKFEILESGQEDIKLRLDQAA